MNIASHYYLNGEEPQLIGQCCTGLVLLQFYESRLITDQVNVAYLRFAEQWHRLYFEGSTIFWRKSEPPANPENATLAHGLLLNDLSGMENVIGQVVEMVTYSGFKSGEVRTIISFVGGKKIEFVYNCEADATSFVSQ